MPDLAKRDWVSLGIAVVALIGVTAGVMQKRRADCRDQWWKRVQWGLERILDADQASKLIGYTVLTALVDSELATSRERDMLEAITMLDLELMAEDLGTQEGVAG